MRPRRVLPSVLLQPRQGSVNSTRGKAGPRAGAKAASTRVTQVMPYSLTGFDNDRACRLWSTGLLRTSLEPPEPQPQKMGEIIGLAAMEAVTRIKGNDPCKRLSTRPSTQQAHSLPERGDPRGLPGRPGDPLAWVGGRRGKDICFPGDTSLLISLLGRPPTPTEGTD